MTCQLCRREATLVCGSCQRLVCVKHWARREGQCTTCTVPTYRLYHQRRGDEDLGSIRCLVCGLTSYNPSDVENLYCGKCHLFHERRAIQVGATRGESHAE